MRHCRLSITRTALTFVAAAFLGSPTGALLAREPNASDLVDKMIRQPGDYDQLCAELEPLSAKVELPLYRMIVFRDVKLSAANLQTLREHRAEVVPELVQRLTTLDFLRPVAAPKEVKFRKPKPGEEGDIPEGDAIENSGLNPRSLSGVFYQMIVGLDAVETLPQLLRLEEQLRSLIAAADADRKAPLPYATPDGALNIKTKLSKRDQSLVAARVTQRELLSVMMQLLRRQQFAPLLESNYEKAYAKVLKERASEEDLRDIKTPADAKAKGEDYLTFDPIYKVPVGYFHEDPTFPFSREIREEMRGLVQQFIDTVPRAQWKVTNEAL